ncbi:hypothetical protein SRHO_G00074460 [Serrasalmus rhombeus]
MLMTFYLLFIGLHVSEEPLPFVPFALVTVIFLHIIVAVLYHTKRNKGPARVHYSTADGVTQIIPYISFVFLFFFSCWDWEESSTGDAEDEVTYSTIVHSNTTRTTTVTDIGEKTEYATIRVNE